MATFDYRQISQDLTKDLPERSRDIISRRFGLDSGEKKLKGESLEAIGVDYGITRERVRQIEKDALRKIKAKSETAKPVFEKFKAQISNFGGLKKEDLYLASLGSEESFNHIFFLLSLDESLVRFSGDDNFHTFWALKSDFVNDAQNTVQALREVLEEKKKPIDFSRCARFASFSASPDISPFIEVSKHIHKTPDGYCGLKDWPEINPKSTRDKIFNVMKKIGKPMHFREIAEQIKDSVTHQTVHNELIKDSRFVLVGRGIYALGDWGFEPGEVKDVIRKILLKSKRPMNKEEIFEEVKKVRIVRDNTINQNLCNKKYFKRNSDGTYYVASQ